MTVAAELGKSSLEKGEKGEKTGINPNVDRNKKPLLLQAKLPLMNHKLKIKSLRLIGKATHQTHKSALVTFKMYH